jgi:hypothetical protein
MKSFCWHGAGTDGFRRGMGAGAMLAVPGNPVQQEVGQIALDTRSRSI